MKVNKLYNTDCRIGLNQMIQEGIKTDCLITSPPYLGLRDYEIEPSIWDGNLNCEHEWDEPTIDHKYSGGQTPGYTGQFKDDHTHFESSSSFCSKCGAWLGTLGLEPNIELYIKHLCDIYDLAWQVLKPTGTNWVNLGDSYGSAKDDIYGEKHAFKGRSIVDRKDLRPSRKAIKGFQKCLLMLPQRFAIEMINRGWILRNVIVWHKPNCMPSSARDRFTIDFEYIYFFVKSSKTQYWINEKTAQLVSKKPLGRKGIENNDWEWRECFKCLGTGIKHKKCKHCEEEGWVYNILLQPEKCQYCKGLGRIKQDEECKSCKGKGIKKYNFWRGRQYYFEQQREPLSNNPATQERYKYKVGSQDNRKDQGINLVKPGKAFSKYFPKNLEYNSKYKKSEHGQTLQGFIRNQSIEKQREQSRIDAIKLFPNNPKKQQKYINYIHDHGYLNGGRNKRCVWMIPTHPNPEAHFATFPPKLVEPMILAGCPKFVCKKCGMPREKIINSISIPTRPGNKTKYPNNIRSETLKTRNISKIKGFKYSDCGCNEGFENIKYSKSGLNLSPTSTILTKKVQEKQFKGYSDCKHGNKWKSGIVLDLFTGLGTTLFEAWKSGRDFIGFEISKEYCQIAEKKLRECKNLRLDKFIYSMAQEAD